MSIDHNTGIPQLHGVAWPTETSESPPESVRALIAELAQIEDALRRAPTFGPPTDGQAPMNPDLVELMSREDRVLRALRSHPVDTPWHPGAGSMADDGKEGV